MFLPLATSGCLVAVDNFWNSILLYHNRPHLVNKRILGVTELYFYEIRFNSNCIKDINDLFTTSAILYEIRKLPVLDKEHLSNLVLHLLQAYDKNVALHEVHVDSFQSRQSGIFVSVRLLLPRQSKCEKCIEIVTFDKENNIATYTAVSDNSKSIVAPPFQYNIELMMSGHVRLVIKNLEDAETASAEWLADKLFPKLVKWAEEYDAAVLTPQSVSLVSIEKYTMLYQQLKEKYGKKMVKIWPENTDPLKFVYEDVAIAAYLMSLWNELAPNTKPSFVDLGCGNGLLVYILNEEGYPGVGIDLRRRKIWDLYPSTVKLEIQSIVPSSTCLFPDADWLIGNHSDELTPWIPVIAARSSFKTNLFLLPCCCYDFNGKKYSRVQTSISQYMEYLEYVRRICNVCGFTTERDKLRIPSTKKTCFISTGRTYQQQDFASVDERITDFINKRCNLEGVATDLDKWASGFEPRPSVEKVRNCTQLDRDLIHKVVCDVVSELLKKENMLDKLNGGYWNAGATLQFHELARRIQREYLKQLKSECGGLQTLLKNHRYIFEVSAGSAKLRVPLEFKNQQKFKDKPCWFYANHPDGCLHTGDVCAYKH